MSAVHLDPEALDPVVKRLRRAQGQLAGILNMIEDGRDCADIVTQIAAVSKAIDRAGFTMQCIRSDEDDTAARERLEKMFMALS
jgi:DNA-binding FrmR family transcriptional regulator